MKSGKRRRAEIVARRTRRAEQCELHEANAAPINPEQLVPSNSYDVPEFQRRGYYLDKPFRCKRCGAPHSKSRGTRSRKETSLRRLFVADPVEPKSVNALLKRAVFNVGLPLLRAKPNHAVNTDTPRRRSRAVLRVAGYLGSLGAIEPSAETYAPFSR